MRRKPYETVFDLRTLEEQIVDTLKARGPLDVVELVTALAVSPRQVQATLGTLVAKGMVLVDEPGFRVYRVVADG